MIKIKPDVHFTATERKHIKHILALAEYKPERLVKGAFKVNTKTYSFTIADDVLHDTALLQVAITTKKNNGYDKQSPYYKEYICTDTGTITIPMGYQNL